MKVLINGAEGQLGKEVRRLLERGGYDVVSFSGKAWDVTSEARTREVFLQHQPEVVIHCAGYKKVDDCEIHAHLAHRINAEGARIVANECQKWDARLIYISTHYVFEGTKLDGYVESDPANPVNQYGFSKLSGERWVQQLCPRHLIIRTSCLYSHHGYNLLSFLLQKAKKGEPLMAAHDLIGSFTYTRHLAQEIEKLLHTDMTGIVHIANEGSCTYYEFAQKALEIFGLRVPVVPISAKDLKPKAPRPLCSHIRSQRVSPMKHWEEGLQDFFEQMLVYE